jgi:alpha-beta hydrolase superfamily lysophospholipase
MTAPRISWITADDGVQLALHRWSEPDCHPAIFYIHGIQSHAGWLFETGPELVKRGVALYALDRRGSGRSGGTRGHVASLDVLLTDYLRGIAAVREMLQHGSVVVLGQSLGGSVLAGLCARGQLNAQGLIFCAPALGQQRARQSPERLAELRLKKGTATSPVSLKDTDYTDDQRYLRFMASDTLMLREVTENTRSTMVLLEDSYADVRSVLQVPTFLATPAHDPIIDLLVARRWLRRLVDSFEEQCFAADRHYLDFSAARDRYWDWLAACAKQATGTEAILETT